MWYKCRFIQCDSIGKVQENHGNFGNFGAKKSKSIWYFIEEEKLFLLFFFLPLFDLKKIKMLKWLKWDLQYNVLLFFQVKCVITSVTGQNHTKFSYFFLTLLEATFFNALIYFFLVFFTIFITMAAQHLKLSPSFITLIFFNPAIVLIQKFACNRHFKVWFGTKVAKIVNFGH